MKSITEKDFASIENNINSVGIELSKITSLVKMIDIALNDELDVTQMDLANLTVLLKEKVFEINKKYDKIEYFLENWLCWPFSLILLLLNYSYI